ncbi:NmrA-like protein [Niveomyces insectorum RCEF 264]|uniref:NmrA-like protein n=1 Tax=Niveomyces insectorum RCEF 264 TaxID=1081102 RepID=A0A162ME73_9HYPO|nr:NmrA-like protein [Niveomyces insectorum RCEF 264]
MSIKNVAVAGGTGNLGRVIVEQLVQDGFRVTLLTREPGTHPAPAGVAGVVGVDYASVASLTDALRGQDAVVSVLGSIAAGQHQKPLVDAAVAAGVRRFIPSEFGVNTRTARGTTIGQVLAGKIATVDYLIEQAAAAAPAGAFTWTGLSTGLFFDWGLERGLFGFDKATQTATLVDSGNEPFQTSTLAQIGRAVSAVLRQAGGGGEDRTANQYLDVASFTPTQQDLLRLVEAAAPSWTVRHVKSADLEAEGAAKLAKGDFSAFGDLLRAWLHGDGAHHAPDLTNAATSGNALLGLAEEDLAALVNPWLKG